MYTDKGVKSMQNENELKPMKVNELIEVLSRYEGNRPVLFETHDGTLETVVDTEQLPSGEVILF